MASYYNTSLLSYLQTTTTARVGARLFNLFQYTYDITVVLVQLRCDVEAAGVASDIGIALLECYLPEEEEDRSNIELLDADFFDDECVVIVYRLHSRESQSNGRFFYPLG